MKGTGKSKETGSTRIPFADRYNHFALPEPNSGCFIWMGNISWNGYGTLKIGYKKEGNRKTEWAHRAAYEYFVGPIPEGMDLDHKCRMRCCVNPDHLEPVTRVENTRRGNLFSVLKARAALQTHCKRGHALSGSNLRISTGGSRLCRTCRTMYATKAWKESRTDGQA
jgi:HNH endonuclease